MQFNSVFRSGPTSNWVRNSTSGFTLACWVLIYSLRGDLVDGSSDARRLAIGVPQLHHAGWKEAILSSATGCAKRGSARKNRKGGRFQARDSAGRHGNPRGTVAFTPQAPAGSYSPTCIRNYEMADPVPIVGPHADGGGVGHCPGQPGQRVFRRPTGLRRPRKIASAAWWPRSPRRGFR